MGESLAQEKSTLLDAKEESRVRIKELEEDIKVLTQRAVERETELERYAFSLFIHVTLLLFLLLAFCGSHVGLKFSVTKSVCVQDEGKSKESWSSEERRGE